MSTRLRLALADLGPSGALPLLLLVALAGVQEFDIVAFGVLSPDIRNTFHISKGGIDVVASLTGALPILGAFVLGYLGDRHNRIRLSRYTGLLFGVTAVCTGLAPVLVILILARILGGTGLLTIETVYPSLMADYYPPDRMGRVFGTFRFGSRGLALVAGPIAGVVAAVAGWRTAFVALALPTFVLVALLAVLHEPGRGASQGLAVTTEPLGSIPEGFRRVRSIPSARRIWVAAFLFGAGTVPFATLLSNFFHDVYHLGDAERGYLSALYGVGGLIGVALGGWLTQRELKEGRPRRLPVINGIMILEFAAGILLMAASPILALSIVAAALLSVGAFGFLPAYTTLVALVAPPRLRSQAYAWTLFFYALGAVLLSVVIGGLSNADGDRVALIVLAGLVAGGGLISMSAERFMDRDIENAVRLETASKSTALLACTAVEAGYGGVQILFGVDFEIDAGEIVAIVGTNGAGKSTFLRTISGLLDPTGGSIFLDGRDISHADPMTAARLGIVHVPGGRGIFPGLSVAENLRVATWLYRKDARYSNRAIDQVVEYFPVLRERWNTAAGDLSGGEQQMLSLGQAFIARPKLLLIDELSLGLAPSVVQRLLDIVRAIHDQGTTVILVEQSVNTALRLAQRAVFMEKGEVRFSGPTAELLDRPDILRAVFLQGAAATAQPLGNGKAGSLGEVILATHGLTKRYGGVTAVDGVDIELHDGEILGFIGPNGAGKTTLFDMISGFTRVNAGRVDFDGHDITTWPAHRRAAAGLGRSFQDTRLWPGLTVTETLSVALQRHGDVAAAFPTFMGLPSVADTERAILRRVRELIELMSLGAFRDKFIAELSTGSRRMVELACMLALRPTVLLLDEPSSGIAQRETEALGPLIRRLRDELGCSVLIIEHDMPLISSLADHLVGLEEGAVVAYGAPKDVLNHPRVVEAYLGTAAAEELIRA